MLCLPLTFVRRAGGNQRELARAKNAKKSNEQSKGKRNEDGLSAAARKQRYTNDYKHDPRSALRNKQKSAS